MIFAFFYFFWLNFIFQIYKILTWFENQNYTLTGYSKFSFYSLLFLPHHHPYGVDANLISFWFIFPVPFCKTKDTHNFILSLFFKEKVISLYNLLQFFFQLMTYSGHSTILLNWYFLYFYSLDISYFTQIISQMWALGSFNMLQLQIMPQWIKLCICLFSNSSWEMPRGGSVDSKMTCIFTFGRYCWILHYRICTHWQCMRVNISPQSC